MLVVEVHDLVVVGLGHIGPRSSDAVVVDQVTYTLWKFTHQDGLRIIIEHDVVVGGAVLAVERGRLIARHGE